MLEHYFVRVSGAANEIALIFILGILRCPVCFSQSFGLLPFIPTSVCPELYVQEKQRLSFGAGCIPERAPACPAHKHEAS